jgi:hypothetical protein
MISVGFYFYKGVEKLGRFFSLFFILKISEMRVMYHFILFLKKITNQLPKCQFS